MPDPRAPDRSHEENPEVTGISGQRMKDERGTPRPVTASIAGVSLSVISCNDATAIANGGFR